MTPSTIFETVKKCGGHFCTVSNIEEGVIEKLNKFSWPLHQHQPVCLFSETLYLVKYL
jgi:hypothetical protein